MHHPFLVLGAALGATGVGLGAFGAHALKAMLEESGRLGTWETAVLYHLVHALALIAVAAFALHAPDNGMLRAAGWCFFAGSAVFSGSLYVLCLTGTKWLGAITPIGGLLMIGGWICLLLAGLRPLS